MATQKPSEWANSLLNRFEEQVNQISRKNELHSPYEPKIFL